MSTQKTEKRVPGIDLLRGLCIVAVVLHHINLRIHFRDSSLGHRIGPAANRLGIEIFSCSSPFQISLKDQEQLPLVTRVSSIGTILTT